MFVVYRKMKKTITEIDNNELIESIFSSINSYNNDFMYPDFTNQEIFNYSFNLSKYQGSNANL